MRRVGTRQLKNRLSSYVRRVQSGERILITVHGKPVVEMVPFHEERRNEAWELRLQQMEAAGHIRLAKHPFKFRKFKPVKAKGKPASQMIIEDRR